MNFTLIAAGVIALTMLVWDSVEVGRNDAANLVNAVFGARLMARRRAVLIAGLAVILGATFSSQVIETTRKGIFDPTALGSDIWGAIAIYVSVYVVDTVLLYGFSAFGMPVSTTATLVASLMGAACAVGGPHIVRWGNVNDVALTIVYSIAFSGIGAFVVQRISRWALRDQSRALPTLLRHGWWVGGGMCAGMVYFLLLKGMKAVPWVKQFNVYWRAHLDPFVLVLLLWVLFAIVLLVLLLCLRDRMASGLFPSLAILGMVAMAFAFGQNDLANCAAPGLAVLNILYRHIKVGDDVAAATAVNIPIWVLFLCGILLFLGMRTRNAQRVTKTEVNTGSQGDHVALWAPHWCLWLASLVLKLRKRKPALAPAPTVTALGKKVHYDPLRASVMMAVAASVIALASDLGMPVSTTYVAFATILGSGLADRVYQRGDANLKIGRAIWVVFSWFAGAALAIGAAAVVALSVYKLQLFGMALAIAVNLVVRRVLQVRGDAQQRRIRDEARERMDPDRYATEYA